MLVEELALIGAHVTDTLQDKIWKFTKMFWPWNFLDALNRAWTYIWIVGWTIGTDWWLIMCTAHVIDTLQDKSWKLEEIT